MCGRYELHTHPAAHRAGVRPARIRRRSRPRYNIAPMQDVPVIRLAPTGERELAHVRWGLVPRWAKDPSIGARMINARAETLAEKPVVPHRAQAPSLPRARRRLLRMEGRARRAASSRIHIGMKDGAPFALRRVSPSAGSSPDGEVLDTCTIVTTPANALLAPLHDRMPVIVAPEDYARWLDVGRGRDGPPVALSGRRDDLLPGVHARQHRAQRRRDADRAGRSARRERATGRGASARAGRLVLGNDRPRIERVTRNRSPSSDRSRRRRGHAGKHEEPLPLPRRIRRAKIPCPDEMGW